MNVRPHTDGFFGEQGRSQQAGGFCLAHWRTDFAKGKPPAHGHTEAHFMYVPAGASYITEARGRPAACGAQLVFNPAGTYHRDYLAGPGRFFSVTLSDDLTRLIADLYVPGSPTQIGHPCAHRIVRQLIDLCDKRDAGHLESLCLELMATLLKPAQERHPARLARAIEIMHADKTTNIGVREVAARVGIHAVHLARMFREHMGCSPAGYIHGLRMRRAAELLKTTQMRVAEIALATGFADQSHFTKQFRRFFAVPPGEYRRLASS